ncbi:glycosyltransferase [candidate division KSB1 bacterium]|nr:glycosyltransferase [candidate division KSB1 bacterium]RQW09257.1 MAG: glycosyltransferase [candidate division KSB1 bacterium]
MMEGIDKSMLVTVILPSYNQKHVIFDALDSVLRQKTNFPYEVIVVESSGDDTAELIRQRYSSVKVIELSERAFPGTARNHAIRVARGEYLAFTDTDCIVKDDWLQELVNSHRRGYRVVGGRVLNGTPRSIAGTIDYLLEFSEFIKSKETTDNTHFGTCNLSFAKTVFDEYGLFIDQVKGSDSLYCRRVKEKGTELFYQPKAVIWHRNRTSLRKIIKNQRELGYGAAINRHKYKLKGVVFVKYPLLLPLLPLVRILAIGRRLYKSSAADFIKFILLLPMIFYILLRYTGGFIEGRRAALAKQRPI